MRGFTLVELLITIAIISILAVVVVIVLNPIELIKQARDSTRVTDMANLKHAVGLYLTENPYGTLASSSAGYGACYLSTTSGNGTSSPNCGIFKNTFGKIASSSSATYRNNDSTGWVPVNFHLTIGVPLGPLPVDPVNNAFYYYGYAATTTSGSYFEFGAFIESKKYGYKGASDVITPSGSSNTSTIETGNIAGLSL